MMMKQDIFNHIVGKYNKIKNETFYTSMTTDINEALDVKKNYGGRIIPIEYRASEKPVDEIEEEEDNEASGNINLFYDKGICFDLYFDLIEVGIEPSVSIKKRKVLF